MILLCRDRRWPDCPTWLHRTKPFSSFRFWTNTLRCLFAKWRFFPEMSTLRAPFFSQVLKRAWQVSTACQKRVINTYVKILQGAWSANMLRLIASIYQWNNNGAAKITCLDLHPLPTNERMPERSWSVKSWVEVSREIVPRITTPLSRIGKLL